MQGLHLRLHCSCASIKVDTSEDMAVDSQVVGDNHLDTDKAAAADNRDMQDIQRPVEVEEDSQGIQDIQHSAVGRNLAVGRNQAVNHTTCKDCTMLVMLALQNMAQDCNQSGPELVGCLVNLNNK